jgi:hypothetical protein
MAKKQPIDQAALIDAIKKQGIELFRERSGMPLNQAQRNLQGRTHYVDDATLKSFGAKVHTTHVMDDGLIFGMVESLQKGFNPEDGRVWRPVFFDLFGNIVARPPIEDSFDNIKQAQAEFWKLADTLDAQALTIEGVEKKYDVLEKELKEWKKFWDIFA